MKERLRYRSWTIGAKTLVSHALLALFAIVFACVVAYALSFRYVQDQAMEELVQQAEYIASCDVTDALGSIVIGAVAGVILGAKYGAKGIPAHWIEKTRYPSGTCLTFTKGIDIRAYAEEMTDILMRG